jgi:hypothetical protein
MKIPTITFFRKWLGVWRQPYVSDCGGTVTDIGSMFYVGFWRIDNTRDGRRSCQPLNQIIAKLRNKLR